MNTRTYVKGDTPEAKFASIERTLMHFSRRLHKTITAVIPPDLTFGYVNEVPEDGVILRAIFPAGRLLKGFMYVEQYIDKHPVTFIAEIHSQKGIHAKNFQTRKQLLVIDPDLELEIGDRLIFRVVERANVKGIWIGFLFHIEVKDSVKETFLLDQIDKLSEEYYDAESIREGTEEVSGEKALEGQA